MTTDPIPAAEAAAEWFDNPVHREYLMGTPSDEYAASIRAVVAELKAARERLKRYESYLCTDSTEFTEMT